MTRNWPFFQFKARKEKIYLLNNSISKNKAKLLIFDLEQHTQNSFILGDLSQVSDYFINKQSGSAGSSKSLLSSIFSYLKSLLETTKTIFSSIYFSLKYRFFWIENEILLIRKNIVWSLERNFSTREATLAKAFVFADLSGAPETIYHSFKVIGILHLIAASSANIYLILAFFKPLLAFLEYWKGQKIVFFAQFLIILVYFLLINGHFNLVDSSPSILRASLSSILAFLAVLHFNLAIKRLNLLITVGILCLLINPFYLQSLGFQLSFLASFIILYYWPYIKKKIAKSVFMLSFTVQFFLWPLLIHYFANLNFIAIPANVLLSPLVELLTVIYFLFISFFSFQFNFLADLTKNLIYFVSNIFFYLLDIFDKIPAKAIEINQHKSLIISSLLFIHLLFIFLIYYDKSSFHNKNKYRIFYKWQNWSKG